MPTGQHLALFNNERALYYSMAIKAGMKRLQTGMREREREKGKGKGRV